MLWHWVILAAAAGSAYCKPSPLSSAHVRFESPHQVYSHAVQLTGGAGGGYQSATHGMLGSFLPREYLLDRRSRYIQTSAPYYPKAQLLETAEPTNPEMMSPHGVFLPPDHQLQFLQVEDTTADPLLLTGEEARVAVANLAARGELYFDAIPHVRALLRHEEERRRNGLATHLLSSNRPESPFYRGLANKA